MDKITARYKFNAMGGKVYCPICDRQIYASDFPDVEYVKTRRKTHLFIHSGCFRKGR